MSSTDVHDLSPLARKVYTTFSGTGCDINADAPLSVAQLATQCDGSRELDLLDWGICFGTALGIARGEDPYESTADVTARAMGAAREVIAWWGPDSIGSILKQPVAA